MPDALRGLPARSFDRAPDRARGAYGASGNGGDRRVVDTPSDPWCTLAPEGRRKLPLRTREAVMNEDTFNIEVRKFLKEVGVTSQREIESAVRRALEAGRLEGDEKLKVSARIQIEPIGLDHRVEGEIALS